jgi:hypothetical protein
MTVLYKIQIAKISQYLSAADVANGGLFGGRLNPLLPTQLYIERKAVEYRYDYEGVISPVQATSTITFDTFGGVGALYHFEYNDPDLGVIVLGDYTEQSGDTDTTILASNVTAELNNNTYNYVFASTLNVMTCTAPLRLGAEPNDTALTCYISVPKIVLTTEVTPNASAAPSSADNIFYILKVDNQTPSVQALTNIASYIRGTHLVNDFFSLDAFYNTSPLLAGAGYLNSVASIDNNVTQYNISVTQNISANSIGYLILVLSVNATPTAGRTGFINGATDPVVLTFTGSPSQDNQQSNLSGVITIT